MTIGRYLYIDSCPYEQPKALGHQAGHNCHKQEHEEPGRSRSRKTIMRKKKIRIIKEKENDANLAGSSGWAVIKYTMST